MNKIIKFCINLEHRTDRWIECEKEFKLAKIRVLRFPAIKKIEEPQTGCTYSHLNLIKKASLDKHDYICVFEDDIHFNNPEKFKKNLKDAIEKVPKDWHILYLWWLAGRWAKFEKVNNNIYKIKNIGCTYAICYHKRSFQKLIKYIPLLCNKKYTIDTFLAKIYQNKYPCYMYKNILVSERWTYSDIDKKIKKTSLYYSFRFFCYTRKIWWILNWLWKIKEICRFISQKKYF